MKLLLLFTLLLACSTTQTKYPKHWWKPVPKKDLKWWEISPDTATAGEVILSKRNELGLLSNFANTPFKLDGKRYRTVESLWQSMKYPEDATDPRAKIKGWPFTRAEVEQFYGFTAKKAGTFGSKVMDELKIDWVTYQGRRFVYRTPEKGEHYKLIVKAMRAKMDQNPEVRKVLLRTGDLILKPDHKVSKDDPPAWKYYQIWMELRAELKK